MQSTNAPVNGGVSQQWQVSLPLHTSVSTVDLILNVIADVLLFPFGLFIH